MVDTTKVYKCNKCGMKSDFFNATKKQIAYWKKMNFMRCGFNYCDGLMIKQVGA